MRFQLIIYDHKNKKVIGRNGIISTDIDEARLEADRYFEDLGLTQKDITLELRNMDEGLKESHI